MSETRVPLCPVRGCPAPSDPDFHVPWCGHGLVGSHHHVVKRSQGGKKGVQVFLCNACHDAVDNQMTMGNAVLTMPDGSQIYRVWNLRNETVVERALSGSGQESLDGRDQGLGEKTPVRVTPHVLPLVSPAEDPSIADVDELLESVDRSIALATGQPQASLLHLSEEELALYYAQALQRSGHFYLEACSAVAEYARRARAAGEENWTEAATTLFSASRRTLQRQVQVYTAVTEAFSAPALAEHAAEVMALPTGTLQLLAQSPAENREAAFLVALGHQAEFSEATPSAVAHDLAEAGIIERPSYAWVCPACGHEAGRAEFRRPLE